MLLLIYEEEKILNMEIKVLLLIYKEEKNLNMEIKV